MMSKLVSDLFDISELAHHGPENLFISLINDNRFVHFSVYDKPYACGSYAYSCGAYACIFIWTE